MIMWCLEFSACIYVVVSTGLSLYMGYTGYKAIREMLLNKRQEQEYEYEYVKVNEEENSEHAN